MVAAGERYERYVKDAMADAGIKTLAELARKSHISESMWHSHFRGARRPRMNTLRSAAAVLLRTPEQLAAVLDGERPPSAPSDPVLAALVEQTGILRDILEVLRHPDDNGGHQTEGSTFGVTLSVEPPAGSKTLRGVREGDERDLLRRGHEGPNTPVPLRPRRPPDNGEG